MKKLYFKQTVKIPPKLYCTLLSPKLWRHKLIFNFHKSSNINIKLNKTNYLLTSMCKYLEEMQKCPCKFTNSLQMYACISQAETMHVCKFVNISARMNEREYSDGISLGDTVQCCRCDRKSMWWDRMWESEGMRSVVEIL